MCKTKYHIIFDKPSLKNLKIKKSFYTINVREINFMSCVTDPLEKRKKKSCQLVATELKNLRNLGNCFRSVLRKRSHIFELSLIKIKNISRGGLRNFLFKTDVFASTDRYAKIFRFNKSNGSIKVTPKIARFSVQWIVVTPQKMRGTLCVGQTADRRFVGADICAKKIEKKKNKGS